MDALLERLDAAAAAYADTDGWSAPTLYHLVLALLDVPEAATIIECAGADLAEYRAAVADRIRVTSKRAVPGLRGLLEAYETAARSQGQAVSVRYILGLMARTQVSFGLAFAGIQPVDILEVLAHGSRTATANTLPPARVVGGGWFGRRGKKARYRAVIHDDAYTTAEFVVATLVQQCSISLPIAEDLVKKIGTTGKVSLGADRLDRVLALIERVHAAARAAGFPLRVTCEPFDD